MSLIRLLPVLLLALLGTAIAKKQPNIVLIMADDMGYSDIGCYGGEIRTPVLDKLAANGLRYTQFYNAARCCPTRAALLTGLYSHQAGMGLMEGDHGWPGYRGTLNKRCVTLAEALRPAGYSTYMSGKWHVDRNKNPKGDISGWPLQRGFDRFYGTITGAGSFYDPATLCRGNTYITPENDPKYQPNRYYYTDATSDNAVAFISDHCQDPKTKEKPFFVYVSYTCAHWPMHAPDKDVAKYKGAYDKGYHAIREARHRKAIEMGVVDKKWPMSRTAMDWEKFEHKAWDIRCMEVYAAMVEMMDSSIGDIVQELEMQKRLDDTIVIYLQDNGGCAEGYGRRNNSQQAERFKFKPLGKDGLQTKIWPPMQTRDGRFVRTGPETMPGGEDTFVAYGAGWANTSNTPFRGYKHDNYEGGIGTPFIVHWPTGIPKERNGKVVHDVSHLIDLMPTFVEAGGATYPDEHAGEKIQPMEGVSILPTFTGKTLERKAPLGFEHHGNVALRDGKWKIVAMHRRDQEPNWELYDMAADRTEQNNLAAKMPDKVKAMNAAWRAWADRVGVQPYPIPRYQKK